MKTTRAALVIFGLVGTVVLGGGGCDRKPARVEVPQYSPAAIAQGAMEKYDTNRDGVIDGEELQKAPSLRDHPELPTKLIDRDGDGQLTSAEIQARAEQWIASKVGIMTFQCTVMLDGQPLEGATVKFIPEPFMGAAVKPASGITDENGSAVPGIDDADLPPNLKGFTGMQSGFYTVEITHPDKTIPARYNTETTLGQEVASDLGSINVVFDLTSR